MSKAIVQFGERTGAEGDFADDDRKSYFEIQSSDLNIVEFDIEKKVREMIGSLSWVRGYINVKSLDDEDIKHLKAVADWVGKLEKGCRDLRKDISKVK